jgi:putative nucleotidyltransferase with HDIG domain
MILAKRTNIEHPFPLSQHAEWWHAHGMGASGDGGRWRRRRLASWGVRGTVLAVPVFVATACGAAVAGFLPRPVGLMASAVWWVAVLGSSFLAFLAVGRAARRFLPLAALLKLTLIFPDRAPARLTVAMRSINLRRMRAWASTVAEDDPDAELAARITSVLALAAALNAHDRRTRGHSERVRALTALIADEMGLDEAASSRLQWAALLHDIGKLVVPSAILNKPGDPDPREWEVLHRHPIEGARLAAPLREWLGPWMGAISEHHEHYDGSGYPLGLSGEDISFGARVVNVTDSFETMTALRSYNRPISVTAARAELVRCAGGQFDPQVVRAFLAISLGPLYRTVGLAAWLAEVPVLGHVPRAAALLGNLSGAATAGTVAVTGVASIVVAAGLSVGDVSHPITTAGAVTTAGHDGGNPSTVVGATGSTQESVVFDPLGTGAVTSDPAGGPSGPGASPGSPGGGSSPPAADPGGGGGGAGPNTSGGGKGGNGNNPNFVPPGLTKLHPPGPALPGGRDPLPVPISVPGVGLPGGPNV